MENQENGEARRGIGLANREAAMEDREEMVEMSQMSHRRKTRKDMEEGGEVAEEKEEEEKTFSIEKVFDGNPVPSWREQVTFRAMVVAFFLSVMFSFIVMKLNLTTGIIPSLNVAAGLLGFFFIKTWTKALGKTGLLQQPFTRQENTVIQTCVVAASGIAFSGMLTLDTSLLLLLFFKSYYRIFLIYFIKKKKISVPLRREPRVVPREEGKGLPRVVVWWRRVGQPCGRGAKDVPRWEGRGVVEVGGAAVLTVPLGEGVPKMAPLHLKFYKIICTMHMTGDRKLLMDKY